MNHISSSTIRTLCQPQGPGPQQGGYPPLLVQDSGPLDSVRGARVLALFDMENLAISASRLGYRFDYTSAAKLLRSVARTCHLHAFFSRTPGDETDADLLRSAGYTPHPRDIETVISWSGMKREANADNYIAYFTGLLCSRVSVDIVLLGSGDGNLVCDLARAITELPTARKVVTFSLPGSTSQRLDATKNMSIAANIEIGT
jgi:hypothetical protein